MELILIRGLPGSGKSTFAKNLTKTFRSHYHLESDMWFGPEYKFDQTKLREAHEWCLHGTKTILFSEGLYEGVIVSNTFTTKAELKPYFELARRISIIPTVIECTGTYGSIHNVPDDIIEKMRLRFESDIFELYEELQCEI
ncbi:ATP-binding protein [Candidatus Dojkabacteria bacterium]|jgi:hypothetical protein|nr:ATP-binding protein [Candidatus Dojkabacteria bacterium]